MFWLASLAVADVPLPRYSDELVLAEWLVVNERIEAACARTREGGLYCDDDTLKRALLRIETFQYNLFEDARLQYLAGLAWKLRGYPAEAQRKYRRAVALDANRQDAWHDLGEIALSEGRFDDAAMCFTAVAELVDTGPSAWIGPWRLAEVAAHQQRPDEFENHMREALRRGFSFNQVRGLPNWKTFYADPIMRDSIVKMVTVYGRPEVLQSLEPDREP